MGFDIIKTIVRPGQGDIARQRDIRVLTEWGCMEIGLFGGSLRITGATEKGPRPENQDCFVFAAMSSGEGIVSTPSGIRGFCCEGHPDMLLAAVCDGLGGMEGGDKASRETCNLIAGWAESAVSDGDPAGEFLTELRRIESSVMRDVPNGGTTVSAIIASDGGWTSIHVGDSRCYAVLPDGAWRTADQSPVEEMYRRGEITEERMNTHPRSNLMDWCLGNGGSRHAVCQPVPGGWTRLALCTDGAFGYMPPDDFRSLVRSADDAETIVARSLEIGGTDNSTVVVIDRTG